MVSTIKFSEFVSGNVDTSNNTFVGLSVGDNAIFPTFFSWTVATRPVGIMNGFAGFNSDLEQWEFWNAAMAAWIPLQSGIGSVSEIDTGTGLTGGPITTFGTISLEDVINNTLLANISGSTNPPLPHTLSDVIDSSFGNVQGDILYRTSTGWVVLSPGPAGNVFQTGGPAANPLWLNFTGTGDAVFENTPTIITPNIVGVTNGSNASAGTVGEFVSSVVAAPGALITSSTPFDVTSIMLTAGDWDVWGNVAITGSANGLQQSVAWSNTISTVSPNVSLSNFFVSTSMIGSYGQSIPSVRYNLTTNTTIFLSGNTLFVAGTCRASGGIYARRAR